MQRKRGVVLPVVVPIPMRKKTCPVVLKSHCRADADERRRKQDRVVIGRIGRGHRCRAAVWSLPEGRCLGRTKDGIHRRSLRRMAARSVVRSRLLARQDTRQAAPGPLLWYRGIRRRGVGKQESEDTPFGRFRPDPPEELWRSVPTLGMRISNKNQKIVYKNVYIRWATSDVCR